MTQSVGDLSSTFNKIQLSIELFIISKLRYYYVIASNDDFVIDLSYYVVNEAKFIMSKNFFPEN